MIMSALIPTLDNQKGAGAGVSTMPLFKGQEVRTRRNLACFCRLLQFEMAGPGQQPGFTGRFPLQPHIIFCSTLTVEVLHMLTRLTTNEGINPQLTVNKDNQL